MYIERVPNRGSKPCILLRESYREGGRVMKRTLANLSKLPAAFVAKIERLIRGGVIVDEKSLDAYFDVGQSLPYGAIAAVLGLIKQLDLPDFMDRRPGPERDLVLAMIVQRILKPRSKLATTRALKDDDIAGSLAQVLDLGYFDENDLYAAMDWLWERRDAVEKCLASRHLKDGCVVLYDVSSSYMEGHCCPLTRFGHSRDGRPDKGQIVYGLLCDGDGCPVAVEVFSGNTADPNTLQVQLDKLRLRFGIHRVIMVGDRGMLTEARIRKDLEPTRGLSWVSALRSPAIKSLMAQEAIQLSLFDEKDLVEINSPDFPGERLVACRNPRLAAERNRKRRELLDATEEELRRVVAATQRRRCPLRGAGRIGMRVGQVLAKHKMGKHFETTITDTDFSFTRKEDQIAAEAALDGFYVIRTNVPLTQLSAEQTVETYKGLSHVEQAFRSMKTIDLKVRPVFHYNEDRVRTHVFLCMLAYYVEWHMRQALKPLLFDDDQPEEAASARSSPVAQAKRSQSAQDKAATKKTPDGWPVHSFRTLLDNLDTIALSTIEVSEAKTTIKKVTRLSPYQAHVFKLLGVSLPKM